MAIVAEICSIRCDLSHAYRQFNENTKRNAVPFDFKINPFQLINIDSLVCRSCRIDFIWFSKMLRNQHIHGCEHCIYFLLFCEWILPNRMYRYSFFSAFFAFFHHRAQINFRCYKTTHLQHSTNRRAKNNSHASEKIG